ncbi:hypothetical protein M427DRAFT_72959 [Gonapodya prolifera JEL478]|uniref:Ankyrin n=1 Tax=Gonapodya prolifera (strain JEL478) TaxID=1344416 RepID=A0A139A414_GONPJ|nr:hypothetical protein M427DRAFT_72959 [Gonapodya prolifera JEL478]|eukprot:KXS11328.1 hypothetical protein M427DRAFT_72959 [Gonapodya prolifera JEL478]
MEARPSTPPQTFFTYVSPSPSASIVTILRLKDDAETSNQLDKEFADCEDEEKLFQDEEGRTIRVRRRRMDEVDGSSDGTHDIFVEDDVIVEKEVVNPFESSNDAIEGEVMRLTIDDRVNEEKRDPVPLRFDWEEDVETQPNVHPELDARLLEAIETSNLKAIEHCIRSGANPNVRKIVTLQVTLPSGEQVEETLPMESCLALAIRSSGDETVELVRMLLLAGADPNAKIEWNVANFFDVWTADDWCGKFRWLKTYSYSSALEFALTSSRGVPFNEKGAYVVLQNPATQNSRRDEFLKPNFDVIQLLLRCSAEVTPEAILRAKRSKDSALIEEIENAYYEQQEQFKQESFAGTASSVLEDICEELDEGIVGIPPSADPKVEQTVDWDSLDAVEVVEDYFEDSDEGATSNVVSPEVGEASFADSDTVDESEMKEQLKVDSVSADAPLALGLWCSTVFGQQDIASHSSLTPGNSALKHRRQRYKVR